MIVGNLQINVVSAKLKRDTEIFGMMDPYVKFKLGQQTFKTKTATDQGKSPTWNQQMSARVQGEQMLNFDIWDKDTGNKDDYIAQGSFNLQTLTQYPQGQMVNQNVPLNYKGKDAGFINLQFIFHPDYQQQQQQQQFYPQQQQQQQFYPQQQQQQQFYPQQQQQQQFYPQQQQQQQFYPQQQQQQYHPQQQQIVNPMLQNPMQQYPQQQQQFMPQYPQQQQQQYYPQQQNMQYQQQQFQQQKPQLFMGKYPMIQFNPGCEKCRGTGINKKKQGNPCGKCYKKAGYCKKCCGTKWDIKKQKACTKCKNGMA